MVGSFNLIYNFFNFAVRINEKSYPSGTHVFFAIHIFLNPHAVIIHNLLIGIGNKREGEGEFVLEFFMGGH